MQADPRPALRATLAQWLRIRAKVRRLATSLVAREHALMRDARGTVDPMTLTLSRQLAAERVAIEAIGHELDARIAKYGGESDAIEAHYIAVIVARARAACVRPAANVVSRTPGV